ncbi:MAG: hypothetical protein C4347_01905 [Patescibacteria group bacterium]
MIINLILSCFKIVLMKALTLFEVLLVLIVLSIILGFSLFTINFRNQSRFIFNETLKFITKNIDSTREKAVLNEDNALWEIKFVNSSTIYFFDILKNNTTSQRFTLPPNIVFERPSNNSFLLVSFEKFTGKTTFTYLQIRNKITNEVKYVCIPTSSPAFISNDSICLEF